MKHLLVEKSIKKIECNKTILKKFRKDKQEFMFGHMFNFCCDKSKKVQVKCC